MVRLRDRDYKQIVERILWIMREYRCLRSNSIRCEAVLHLKEDSTFYIFRTDNNAVLARGIQGFEAAKSKANELRKSHGLKWDEVKFKAERQARPFGVSPDGKSFTNARGQSGRMDYSPRFNPSKGRRFRGYYDRDGNYHDID